MRPDSIRTLLAACALLYAGAAAAEDVGAPATGYRVADTDGGFQLVEHGFWQQPEARQAAGFTPIGPIQASAPVGAGRPRSSHFRRASYLPRVQGMEARFGLPAGLLDALVWTESRYNPLAISKAGAAGLGQLMPGTARDLGVANRFDPAANLEGAARYLRQMLDEFGVVHLALAAYNAGPGAVKRAGGIPRNGETPRYVRDVLRHWRF
jgi:soluble lytic murein transglycosylase-like protein